VTNHRQRPLAQHLQLLPCGCSRCLLAITADIDAVHE
jgi:hypothetical protein